MRVSAKLNTAGKLEGKLENEQRFGEKYITHRRIIKKKEGVWGALVIDRIFSLIEEFN